jgi:hypothetical protein
VSKDKGKSGLRLVWPSLETALGMRGKGSLVVGPKAIQAYQRRRDDFLEVGTRGR